MVLNATVPAGNVKELVALARNEPGALNYASSGNGSLLHLSGELFKSLAGVTMTHIPYKGLAAALPDMFAGRVHMTFSSITTALPHIKGARLRPIGVTSKERCRTGYCGVIPAAFASFATTASSLTTNLSSSAGVVGAGSAPSARICF